MVLCFVNSAPGEEKKKKKSFFPHYKIQLIAELPHSCLPPFHCACSHTIGKTPANIYYCCSYTARTSDNPSSILYSTNGSQSNLSISHTASRFRIPSIPYRYSFSPSPFSPASVSMLTTFLPNCLLWIIFSVLPAAFLP